MIKSLKIPVETSLLTFKSNWLSRFNEDDMYLYTYHTIHRFRWIKKRQLALHAKRSEETADIFAKFNNKTRYDVTFLYFIDSALFTFTKLDLNILHLDSRVWSNVFEKHSFVSYTKHITAATKRISVRPHVQLLPY